MESVKRNKRAFLLFDFSMSAMEGRTLRVVGQCTSSPVNGYQSGANDWVQCGSGSGGRGKGRGVTIKM